jgi:hypothetical protein
MAVVRPTHYMRVSAGFLTFAAMVYDFPLEDEKVKPHQVTTLHLVCAFAFIGTGAIILVYNYIIPMWGLAALLCGLFILVAAIFKNKWLTGRQINPIVRTAELLIAVCIAIYSLVQQWKFPIVIFGVLSVAILFALYWERAAGNKLYIHIDEEGIKLPVTRRRFIRWSEVEQVILRYGTLTIDCFDNHLFQWNIATPEMDNEVFEAFCTAQVEKNISKRRNDDW